MPAIPGVPIRIAVVASVIARYDAISAAVQDTIRAFTLPPEFQVSILTLRCDFPELGAHRVAGLRELLAHPAFRSADLVIYHFGIYSPLFDAMVDGGGQRRQIVAFHNITPAEFVAAESRRLIERSFRQIENFRHADRLWAISPVNAEELIARGIDPAKIEVIPLAVERPSPASLDRKAAPPVELLYVGRIVASKGTLDLVEAIDLVRSRSAVPFRLRLAGNSEYSDPIYTAAVRDAITARGLSGTVELVGAVDDAKLAALYHAAHILAIPSYHEGFCKPVIEGLRAGCIPVGYAAHNIPHIAHGLGRMVPTGDRQALGNALAEMIEAVAQAPVGTADRRLPLDSGVRGPGAFDQAAQAYVAEFSFERVADQMVGSARRVLRAPI